MKGLSKFPVTTNEGIYYVEVVQDHVAFSIYRWVVNIYVRNEKRSFFKRKEFVKVYEYETGWSKYREYALDLVGLAEQAVLHYEEEVIIFNRNFDKSVERFENWDGVIKEVDE